MGMRAGALKSYNHCRIKLPSGVSIETANNRFL